MTNPSQTVDPCRCPLCGQPNACAMAAPNLDADAPPKGPCWCTRVHFSLELLHKVPPAAKDKACICAACAASSASAYASPSGTAS